MKNPYEPILKEIANGMLETAEIKPNYSEDALLDALFIFQSVLLDKIHNLQQEEKMELKYGLQMAEACGKELRKLIHTFTGLDTVELVNNYEKNYEPRYRYEIFESSMNHINEYDFEIKESMATFHNKTFLEQIKNNLEFYGMTVQSLSKSINISNFRLSALINGNAKFEHYEVELIKRRLHIK